MFNTADCDLSACTFHERERGVYCSDDAEGGADGGGEGKTDGLAVDLRVLRFGIPR